jgi:maltose alpha-D-glucosyltransferase/alpha-amylase
MEWEHFAPCWFLKIHPPILGQTPPLLDILAATPAIPETSQWCTFLRNHDELTLEMVTPEEREYMWETFAPIPRMRLNLGIRRRLAPLLDGDRRKIELLYSILFSLPGSPILYYGDEIGMGDNIWLDDRNGMRTPMQWDGGPSSGFSTAPEQALYAPLIDDERFGYRRINVVAQRADPASLWNTIRRMIVTRKRQTAFGYGNCQSLPVANPAVLALRRAWAGETILALHNLSAIPQTVQLDLDGWRGAQVENLLSDRRFPEIGEMVHPIELGAYEYLWLKVGSK